MDNYGFKNISGYEEVKEELIRILKWYKEKDKIIDKHVDLPKGIIFYGDSGCGKTTLMQEYAEMFNYPIFYLKGRNENLIKEINDVFSVAREEDNAVILIDDLDLLFYDNNNIIRLLIQELDEISNNNSKGNIIVLATAKEINEDSFLFRNGRFDRSFELSMPETIDIKKIIDFYLKKINIVLDENELEYLTNILMGCSGVDIKCIIEDAYLSANGKPTLDDIENSWYLIYYKKRFNNQNLDFNEYDYQMVAVHEAGHILLTYKNKSLINFYRATIQNSSDALGGCKIYPISNKKYCLETILADIEIDIAGYLAQSIICNSIDAGASSDLSDAKYSASLLINELGYKGIKYITNVDKESNILPNEKLINKLLRKKKEK